MLLTSTGFSICDSSLSKSANIARGRLGVLRLIRTLHKLPDLMALGFLTLQITFQVSTAYIALLLAT